jgi:L-2-hydroxyglutarate oxidase LhgO
LLDEGPGVAGLAIARELSLGRCDVIVAEKCAGVGTGISSRNSEVVHAGIYVASDEDERFMSISSRIKKRG